MVYEKMKDRTGIIMILTVLCENLTALPYNHHHALFNLQSLSEQMNNQSRLKTKKNSLLDINPSTRQVFLVVRMEFRGVPGQRKWSEVTEVEPGTNL